MKNKFILFLIAIVFLTFTTQGQTIKSWYGILEVQGYEIPLGFHIKQEGDSVVTYMDSPEQKVKNLRLSYTEYSNSKYVVIDKQFRLSYEGTVYPDSVVGVYQQNGMNIPLNLYKSYPVKKVEYKRPQTPKAPFPYTNDTIRFTNKKDGVTIRGLFTRPHVVGNKKYPLVVLISGSGAQDFTCTAAGHAYFDVIADSLARAGMGVLRYDDRGAGESGGNPYDVITETIADDILAGVAKVRSLDASIDKIGLLGHSQGGNVACYLAANYPKEFKFVILLAAPGQNGKGFIKEQVFNLGKLAYKSDEAIQEEWNQTVAFYDLLPQKYDSVQIAIAMRAKAMDQYNNLSDSIKAITSVEKLFNDINSVYNNAIIVDLIYFDPIPYASKIKQPTLILNGDLDVQVQASTNAQYLYKAIKNNAKNVQLKTYPYLNHLFQYAVNGTVDEYEILEETINSEVLKDIILFIKNN